MERYFHVLTPKKHQRRKIAIFSLSLFQSKLTLRFISSWFWSRVTFYPYQFRSTGKERQSKFPNQFFGYPGQGGWTRERTLTHTERQPTHVGNELHTRKGVAYSGFDSWAVRWELPLFRVGNRSRSQIMLRMDWWGYFFRENASSTKSNTWLKTWGRWVGIISCVQVSVWCEWVLSLMGPSSLDWVIEEESTLFY